jgi:predicted ATPase
VHLYTLGKLSLEGTKFKEPMPLLLLAYLALQGKTQRGQLADLLWMSLEEPKRRAVNLSEAIFRLRKLSPQIVQGEGWLETTVTTDVQAFKEAIKQHDIERALELYQGHFLDGIERNPRLSLGEEISEWIINTREALYSDVFEARLTLAGREAFAEKFEQAAEHAWQTYTHGTNVTYASAATYQKLFTLLLAAEHLEEAERVLQEANELYGEGAFYVCEHPAEARARLNHTYNFRPENVLVAREKEIESVLNNLQDHDSRLVSIIGPPGIGKTEVAQAVARATRGQPCTEDGVHVVWLEAIPAETPQTNVIAPIAQALGVKAKTLQDLASAIGDSRRLLILDNFEQLSGRHNSLVADLHQRCPNLRLLITSRELLRLKHESPYLLDYLNRPKENNHLTLEEAQDYPSIELFERAAKPQGFKLTQNNLHGVAQICQLVEGLPLGIKLAASWAGSLSPADIAKKISDELNVLNQTRGSARHDSIQATFESSLHLLSKDERLAVTKLAVFQGEFALDAVEQVTGVNLQMLRTLIEKSLVRYDQETQCYSFHALIGQYVREVLAQDTDLSLEVKTAHANYYLEKLERLPEIEGEEKQKLLRFLSGEELNLRVAWLFALEQGWFERLYVTCKALQNFGNLSAEYTFSEALLAVALENCPQNQDAVYTALASNLGYIRYRLGKYREAIELASIAVAGLEKGVVTSQSRMVSLAEQAYTTLWASYSSLGEFPKAVKLAQTLHDLLLEQAPTSQHYAYALTNLAIVEGDILGRSSTAPYVKALEIFEAHDNQTAIAWVLVSLADQLIREKQLAEAGLMLERAIRLARTYQLYHWLAMSQYHQTRIALYQQDYDAARKECERLLTQVTKQNKPSLLAIVLRLRGEIEYHHPEGNSEEALAFLESGYSKAKQISDVALTNALLVDRLGLLLSLSRFLEATPLYALIKNESGRMYYFDQQKFKQLQEKFGGKLDTVVEVK